MFHGVSDEQTLRERSYPVVITPPPPSVNPHVATIGPTQARKRLNERRLANLPLRIVFVVKRYEYADPPNAVTLKGATASANALGSRTCGKRA